jgi:two-component system, OmpR family, sensor histidine kinase KdpD
MPSDSRLLLLDANEEADRLNRLISNVLQLSRLEAHAVRVNKDWNSFDEVVSIVFRRWHQELTDSLLVAEIPDDLPLLNFDFELIEAVLTNLIENAFRHGCPPVRLSVTLNGSEVWVSIGDTGPGIPVEKRDQLFQAFSTTKASGIGLGLAVCKGLVEAHGGRLWATFEPHQTQFIFALPFVAYSEEAIDDASTDS